MEEKNELNGSKEVLHQMIKAAVNKLGAECPKEQKIAHAKLLVKIFEEGIIPREAMNISDEEISRIYSFAYQLFNSGQYAQALELFKMLLVLEPVENGFAVALGACYHRLHDYENALRCYMLGSALAPDDPLPLFYAYDCCMNLQNKVSAGIMLCNVIAKAGNDARYAKMKERSQALLDNLEKQLGKKQEAGSAGPDAG